MKIKMDYRRMVKIQKELIQENNRLLYEIEKFKRMDSAEEYARIHGLKKISKNDIDLLLVKENYEKK